jgi:hypothetical protein
VDLFIIALLWERGGKVFPLYMEACLLSAAFTISALGSKIIIQLFYKITASMGE